MEVHQKFKVFFTFPFKGDAGKTPLLKLKNFLTQRVTFYLKIRSTYLETFDEVAKLEIISH